MAGGPPRGAGNAVHGLNTAIAPEHRGHLRAELLLRRRSLFGDAGEEQVDDAFKEAVV